MDWKYYLIILGCLNIFVTLVSFLTIKFNDLKHLGKDVNNIKIDVRSNTRKLNKIDKGLAVQKQRIDDLEKSTR